MKIISTRERLLASSMICGAALVGLSATQAQAQATASSGAEVSEIVVTGSRIPQPNLTSVSPVTAVNQQELRLQGTTNVETLLNNLPQVAADFGSGVSNGATGTATVNLRGLGDKRTLVLIDGHRMAPGDPKVPAADLNAIPAALVQRVDVLTGGASAVYGSDAVAGVVNFIMNRNFEGFRVDASYSGYQHHQHNGEASNLLSTAPFFIPSPPSDVWDGQTYDITVVTGVNAPDGKGNVTAYLNYRNLQPILQSQRDYSACSVAATTSGTSGIYDAHVCAGSSNSAFGRFINSNTPKGGFSVNPNGTQTFVPFTNALRFNFAPQNYFQRPDDRYTGGFFAHYDINRMVSLYSDFMFADDHTRAQIASSGLFQGTGPGGTSTFGINCNNPLMSAAQQAQLCGATNAGTAFVQQSIIGFRFAGVPRVDDLRHTTYLIDIGAKGELADGWNYDAYIQYGTAILNEHFEGDVSVRRAQQSLLIDPATGQCAPGSEAGCVPLNLFQAGGLTPAALAFVQTPGLQSGQTSQQIASVSVTGDLGKYGVKSPMANDGIGVAFGAEYHRDSINLETDAEFQSGDLSGQGGPRVGHSGSLDVYELFGEARLPLAQDVPFAKDLNLELGYRFSDYSTAANTTQAYKIGANWAITDDIKIRGGYNRAVRAPNVIELFTPTSVGLFSGQDLCATGNAPVANCIKSGLTAAQVGNIQTCPSAQCNALFGGNPNLQAEKADTYTIGVVLRPHWVPGLDVSVDYFNIKVANLISSLPALTAIDCFNNGTPAACSLFHRDPATGILFGQTGFVNAIETNTGFLQEKGVDIAANYHANFSDWGLGDYGGLAFNFNGTYTQHYVLQPTTGGGTFDCAGLYGPVCSSFATGGPTPKWRHKLRVTWTTPWPLELSAQWRYISRVAFDGNQSNPFLNTPGVVNVVDAHIPAVSYFDLSGTWKVRDTITLRAGVNNVFDKDPKILDSNVFPASGPPFGNGNTYPGTYDALGRFAFVGITADF
ncbi:MAG TPA: TonB-dependent receptor [Phenylobacterium sp.]|uniref:TonB-dependent receptor domain-containing protein n=1 Tax=Phenylobacterium sp. TaxID=1871053 RepID=UPI002C7788B3|nr:TonB-dependent receptor [Phenylobacterium sp.]HSV04076.1 TonB-dependent receptor [Phenylobacterium sp.]